MLLATASQAAFDRSSSGRMIDVVAHADAAVLAPPAPELQAGLAVLLRQLLAVLLACAMAITTAWS